MNEATMKTDTLRVAPRQRLALQLRDDRQPTLRVEVAEAAQLDLLLLNTASRCAALHVQQAAGSCVNLFLLALGGEEVAQRVQVELQGEQAECSIFGLGAASLSQRHSTEVAVHHAAPRCVSRQLFRQLAAGSAVVSFAGKVVVAQDAQHTDARQSCKTLLLSAAAQVHTQPQLEIYADDVKCSHGATVG
ncbi:MAG: SufD family Fe-S cluster assembly protein, partial [Prevotellaceae bacterium]|nr:SufD family Fe-S cluster assembly protein [Prevotellaceae bacterium]